MLMESFGRLDGDAAKNRTAGIGISDHLHRMRRHLVITASLMVPLIPLDSLGADPQVNATFVDVLTNYSWGYKAGAKQPFGSYKNGRSLHAISKRVGSSGTDGSPDQLAWVDEHSGQVFALEGSAGYPDVGINPASNAVFTSEAPEGEQGRLWWVLSGRADTTPFDLVRSSQLFSPLAYDLLLDNFITQGDSTTPCLAVVNQTGLLAYRWLGSTRPDDAVKFRTYDLPSGETPVLLGETTLGQASVVPNLGNVTIEQLWTRWDPRRRALAITWHWFASSINTTGDLIFGSNPFLYTDDLGQSWRFADGSIAPLPLTYGSTTPLSTPYDHIAFGQTTQWQPRDIGFGPSGTPWVTLPSGPISPSSNGWQMTFFHWEESGWQGVALSQNLQGNSDPVGCGTTRDYIVCAYSEYGAAGKLLVRVSRDDGRTWSSPVTVHTLGAAANGSQQRISWVSFIQPSDRYLDNVARFFIGYFRVGETDGKFFKNSIRWVRVQVGSSADFNGDEFVDDTDLAEFSAAHAAGDWRADFNDDGVVDDADLSQFTVAMSEGSGGGDPPGDPGGTGVVFQQSSDGLVSIESEHFEGQPTGWSPLTIPGASNGDGLKAVPGAATSKSDVSQRAEYEVNFLNSGGHTVWVRMRGFASTQNEARVGLDDLPALNRVTTTDGVWQWRKLASQINVATPGVHLIRLYRREQNVEIDKIVLTSGTITPSGTGPPESTRN